MSQAQDAAVLPLPTGSEQAGERQREKGDPHLPGGPAGFGNHRQIISRLPDGSRRASKIRAPDRQSSRADLIHPMSSVRRALVPAAGKGTRMQPFSLVVPKELVPLGGVPVIHRILDEAGGGGIEDVAVVLAPGKELLRRYLEIMLARGAWGDLRLHFLYQNEPTGLADAIARCQDFCAGEPFAVLLPDNLPLAEDYELGQLLRLHAASDRHVVGVLELDARWSGLYGDCGRIRYQTLGDGALLLTRLLDKARRQLTIRPGEVVRRTCGRYVFSSELFGTLEQVRPTVEGEFDEVPVVQRLVEARRVVGTVLPSPLFDVGHAEGLLAASAHLHGLSRDGGML